jgi:hypothetical protein
MWIPWLEGVAAYATVRLQSSALTWRVISANPTSVAPRSRSSLSAHVR